MRRVRSMLIPVRGQIRKRADGIAAEVDWKELIAQRDLEIKLRFDLGLTTLESELAAPDGWRDRVDAQRHVELSNFVRAQVEALPKRRRASFLVDRVGRAWRRLLRR